MEKKQPSNAGKTTLQWIFLPPLTLNYSLFQRTKKKRTNIKFNVPGATQVPFYLGILTTRAVKHLLSCRCTGSCFKVGKPIFPP